MKEYTIQCGSTRAVILPEKGATVISLCRNDTEFLYCDRENLASPDRPRCGIPFLFPIFGRLAEGKYSHNGREYAMEIHGFGHTSVWQVAERSEDSLRLVLSSDERTLSMYPFRFRTELRFQVMEGRLVIYQRFDNVDKQPMPYSFGFHPYFLLDDISHARVETTAGMYFDFSLGKPVPFGTGCVTLSMPEGAPETGAVFMDAAGPTSLHIESEGRRITMDHGADFPQIVLWSQTGKRFLCVEPINGTANGLNTGVHRTLLPGETSEAVLTINIESI